MFGEQTFAQLRMGFRVIMVDDGGSLCCMPVQNVCAHARLIIRAEWRNILLQQLLVIWT